MCTAISFTAKDHYFGRNLDLEYCYQEAVTVTPGAFAFHFRSGVVCDCHPAIIGMATVSRGYPLYYDATNEFGLSMAGLNFPGNAVYHTKKANRQNIAPYELIPWILCRCRTVDEAIPLLKETNVTPTPFSEEYSLTDLHWILSDREKSITVEPGVHGLRVHLNPIGVLTNNPPFDYHLHNLANYLRLSPLPPDNHIAPELPLKPYSRGMGAMGLPGDLSSSSRFIRAVFTASHSVKPESEEKAVGQFFHILGTVAQTEGCVLVGDRYEKTVYSSCCNTDMGIYYYTTYENSQITAVDMHAHDLSARALTSYPLKKTPQIHFQSPTDGI